MKRFILYVSLLAAAAFAAAACNDDKKEPVTPKPEARLTIADSESTAKFEYGQTRSFALTREGVVEASAACPEGWQATLGEDALSVTAPAANQSGAAAEGKVVITYSGADGVAKTAALQVAIDAPALVDVHFKLEYYDVTSTTAMLKVTPDDNSVGYYFDICTEEDFNKYDGDVAYIVSLYFDYIRKTYPDRPFSEMLSNIISYGEDSDMVQGMPPATTFCFYAIAIDSEGNACSQPEVTRFTTLPAGDPSKCTFELSVSNLTTTTALATVKPSDNAVRYWMGIVSRTNYPGDIPLMTDVTNAIAQYAQENDMSIEEVTRGVTFAGERSEMQYDLQAAQRYYLYVFAMNERGESVGPLFKHSFTTPEVDVSDAAVTLDYRWFDGRACHEAFPDRYTNTGDFVVLQVKATPNYFAVDWVVALGAGDMSDPDIYPSDSTINAILASSAGKFTRTLQEFFVSDYGSVCTLLSFAADYMGVNGELSREVVTLTREGVSPISELAPITNSPAALSSFLAPTGAAPHSPLRIVMQPQQRIGRTIAL